MVLPHSEHLEPLELNSSPRQMTARLYVYSGRILFCRTITDSSLGIFDTLRIESIATELYTFASPGRLFASQTFSTSDGCLGLIRKMTQSFFGRRERKYDSLHAACGSYCGLLRSSRHGNDLDLPGSKERDPDFCCLRRYLCGC